MFTGLFLIYLPIIIDINNAIYTIINIYAPNNMKKRNTFFKQVDRFINEYSIGQIILAGDYNDILSNKLYMFLIVKAFVTA
jgi:exonuclease III